VSLDNLPDAYSEGAPAALKRLERYETYLAQRFEAAVKTGDAFQIRAAGEDHSRASKDLLRYDKEVTLAQRDLGHLIPKSEAIEGARAAATWFKLALAAWVSSCLPEVIAVGASGDNHAIREAKYRLQITFAEILAVSIRNSESSREPVPEWAKTEIFAQWHLAE
jgi:hypothetical protein